MKNPACRRFILGVLVIAGVSYSMMQTLFQGEFSVSKSDYYAQRKQAEKLLMALFGSEEPPMKIILVTRHFIERCVMCLSFHCRAPIAGILAFFDLVLGFHISKGSIGRIRERAAENAAAFEEEIRLDEIRDIAIDEIFQQGHPILTGVDLASNYTFLLECAENRSGETWAQKLKKAKAHGLQAELNVSDQGTGLRKGVLTAFPEIALQPDVFHQLRDLGRQVQAADRCALSSLGEYYKLEARVYRKGTKQPDFELWVQYDEMGRELAQTLSQMDDVNTLYGWLKESLVPSGLRYAQNLALCTWILDEMAVRFPKRETYQKAVKIFRENLPALLSFLLRLEETMKQQAKAFPGITEHDFFLLYQQTFSPTSRTAKYECMEQRLFKRFGKRLPEAREALEQMLRNIRRASSQIENLNGRIRCFIDLKREIPENFLLLLKVFFNTRKQPRSRHEGWAGTSAIDRMSGKQYPEFLDLVASPMDYAF